MHDGRLVVLGRSEGEREGREEGREEGYRSDLAAKPTIDLALSVSKNVVKLCRKSPAQVRSHLGREESSPLVAAVL